MMVLVTTCPISGVYIVYAPRHRNPIPKSKQLLDPYMQYPTTSKLLQRNHTEPVLNSQYQLQLPTAIKAIMSPKPLPLLILQLYSLNTIEAPALKPKQLCHQGYERSLFHSLLIFRECPSLTPFNTLPPTQHINQNCL
jgi:hypothetical protein